MNPLPQDPQTSTGTDWSKIDAYLFDLDGVLTPTVDIHIAAWRETFDEAFRQRKQPAFTMNDYHLSLDGRGRFDGVNTLLTARGLSLPWGSETDTGYDTVCGIGNEKNRQFTKILERDGIHPYPGTMRLLKLLETLPVKLAVVSSSRNAQAVLDAAGLTPRFEAVVDGVVAAEEGLPGKPAHDTYTFAAQQLGVEPSRAAIFEDAVSGVVAGAAGNFEAVIGVNRGTGPDALHLAGATAVVDDLAEIVTEVHDKVGATAFAPAQPNKPEQVHARLAQRHYGQDPFRLVWHGIDTEHPEVNETIFNLSNGYLGMRGNHPEGSPLGAHGTFLNGLHETWKIEHAENAYGFAETGQTIVNVPDVKTVRLYIDDERLNLELSEVRDVITTLDMREGTLTRSLVWRTPTGKNVTVHHRRMVSFVNRHIATIEFSVTCDQEADITLSSLILNRQDLGRVTEEQHRRKSSSQYKDATHDPRKSDQFSERVLVPGAEYDEDLRTVRGYQTAHSEMGLAIGVDHKLDVSGEPADWIHRVKTSGDRVRHVFQGTLQAGRKLSLTKVAAFDFSLTATTTELIDRCIQQLDFFGDRSIDDHLAEQREYLDDFWNRSAVTVDGISVESQQAIHWNLYQLAGASARADGRGIAAKGLTGSGYSGHYFWDSEVYVSPFLTYTNPAWARNALRFRETILPAARKRAQQLNEAGALFAWRTINGEEASAYYAAGTAQYHINADIAYAMVRYFRATGDIEFATGRAADIVIETARTWMTLGFWRNERGRNPQFHIHGVTGPDEYTTVVNDNLFTNVMARRNLFMAERVLELLRHRNPAAHDALVERLGITPEEVTSWHAAAKAMCLPFDEDLGIHPQDAHFLEREVWDLEATPADQKPLLLHFHPLVIYRFQVLKQADVVLAMLLADDEFTAEQKRANFEYYDRLTTGDSSLSAVVQAILAAEVGYRELSLDYFYHSLRVDLDNLHKNSGDGVHIASAGGVWMSLVQGYAGMRDGRGVLEFDPRLPEAWNKMEFPLTWRGNLIRVTLTKDEIRFATDEACRSAIVVVRGEEFEIEPGSETVVPLDGQGPDLGDFGGVSAGILPRTSEEEEGGHPERIATEIPTLDA